MQKNIGYGYLSRVRNTAYPVTRLTTAVSALEGEV